jgi:hypothetical protein
LKETLSARHFLEPIDSTPIRQRREDVSGGGPAADVMAMPERVEEQRPRGEAEAALAGMCEEPRDGARLA